MKQGSWWWSRENLEYPDIMLHNFISLPLQYVNSEKKEVALSAIIYPK